MSSFFTLPASQKKRKRNENGPNEQTKKFRNTPTSSAARSRKATSRRSPSDDSISGSESDKSEKFGTLSGEEYDSSDSDIEETGAERRLRLAEEYLENVKGEVDEIGFNAEDVDRDLIAERLKEDVAETKGRLYRHIASDYDFAGATKAAFRFETDCVTSIATCPPYAYTASRDLSLTKWELPVPPHPMRPSTKSNGKVKKPQPTARRRPIKVVTSRGQRHMSTSASYKHHFLPILCVAASSDGRFVATGGEDKRLIVWSATDLKPLRVFTQHRDAVTSLAFRRGTNQLYSASSDRTIKTWSLDEMAYVETLFGHQDQVVDVAALSQERCLSAGARDRTVRLWKVVEETQLVFRGGGGSEKKGRGKRSHEDSGFSVEGSIDRVELIDEETFITGSDNGSLSLWNVHKKKPVFTLTRAHGLDPPPKLEDMYAEEELAGRSVPTRPAARWITALKVIPYSDLVVSGSWDGEVRVWKVTQDMKKIEAIGVIGRVQNADADADAGTVVGAGAGAGSGSREEQGGEAMAKGVINDLDVFERGDKGREGLCIVAALGKHHRLGRWKKVDGKNGAVVFEVPKKATVHEETT